MYILCIYIYIYIYIYRGRFLFRIGTSITIGGVRGIVFRHPPVNGEGRQEPG